jgi:hypothetical protein
MRRPCRTKRRTPQVVLQLGDGAAERGLRHVDAARGLAHATGVQHGEELAQAAGVDVRYFHGINWYLTDIGPRSKRTAQ